MTDKYSLFDKTCNQQNVSEYAIKNGFDLTKNRFALQTNRFLSGSSVVNLTNFTTESVILKNVCKTENTKSFLFWYSAEAKDLRNTILFTKHAT